MSLQIDKYKHDERLTLTDFIYLFLTRLNLKFNTIYANGQIQCFSGKHRSLGDITEICKTYYPNTTMQEVKEILLNFGPKLVGHKCGDIRKRVYQHRDVGLYHWSQGGIFQRDEYDEPIEYRSEDTNIVNNELVNEIKLKY